MKIGLIGLGSISRQVCSMLASINQDIDLIGFDDNINVDFNYTKSAFSSLLHDEYADINFVPCLGYNQFKLKEKLIGELLLHGRKVFSVIHPSAIISPTASIGRGVIIFPGVIIDSNTKIHDGAVLNSGVIVSHNVNLESTCYLAPGVCICGNVTIGKRTFIGAGSILSNEITVGDDCIVGQGSNITRSIKNDVSCIGNPFKILKSKLTLK